ncbi:MAG: hypothetical protein RBR35_05095 [Salinivirgaceae bacterium]|nr:hypothetical protein [Salinivirgaceae bacterium]
MKNLIFLVFLTVMFGCNTPKPKSTPTSDIVGLATPIQMGQDSTVVSIHSYVSNPELIKALIFPKDFTIRRWPDQHVVTLYHDNCTLGFLNYLKIVTVNDTYHILMLNNTIMQSDHSLDMIDFLANKSNSDAVIIRFKNSPISIFAVWENQLLAMQTLTETDKELELNLPAKAKEFDLSTVRIWTVDAQGDINNVELLFNGKNAILK